MRWAVLALLLAQGPDPTRPFPGHEAPPAGWFCEHEAADPAHACTCHRTRICEAESDDIRVQEDFACKVWCHQTHCHCPIECVAAPEQSE